MKKLILVLFISAMAAHGATIEHMAKVCIVDDTPLPEDLTPEQQEAARQASTLYTAGDVMGRVEIGKTSDGKPEGVTIYNDGDMWVYRTATMQGVYERDQDESHTFHATVFPMPALKTLEFGKEGVFISKQQVTTGRGKVHDIPCTYTEATVGDLKVRFYSSAATRQPAFVELWQDGEMAKRFKYISYAAKMPFDNSLFEKPSAVLILNDDAQIEVPEGKLTPLGKRWALACGALLNALNNDRHDLLGGGARTEDNVERWQNGLKRWWGDSNKEDLLGTLDWLMTEGHRTEYIGMGMQLSVLSDADFNELKQKIAANEKALGKITLVRQNFSKTGKTSLRAWDFSRYVNVCGWGYIAGYITEEEAWDLLAPVAYKAQQSFGSWDEFGKNFIIGREYWSGDKAKVTAMQKIHNDLMKNPKSPWRKLKWDTELIKKESAAE